MPDVIDPVPLMLDRERFLYFDKASVRLLELELTKAWAERRTFFQAIFDLATAVHATPGEISVVDLTFLVWYGLLRDDPTLTFGQVEALLPVFSPQKLVPIALAVLQAWQRSSPDLAVDAEAATEVSGAADPLAPSTGLATWPLPVSPLG